MVRKILSIVILLCLCSTMMAQTVADDKELTTLVDVVKMLRVSNEVTFNKATQILSDDTKWTSLDETGPVREDKECNALENVPGFKLNRILSKIEGSRKYTSTHGDMVNGEETRYDYSLFERKLKAKTEVEYHLKGREGKQVFFVVPYHSTAKFEAYIDCDGKKISGVQNPDGIIIVTWEEDVPSRTQDFVLSIKNCTKSSQSFVIINHNTRNK